MRTASGVRLFCCLIFAQLLTFASSEIALGDDLSGQASIIDGDTLEIHGTVIRLWGIDAPESSQLCHDEHGQVYPCGATSAKDLDAFIAKRPVVCKPANQSRDEGIVAECSVDGIDLSDWLVRNGSALDWPEHSEWRFSDAQLEAEHASRGIWKGYYIKPWLFRECMRKGGKPESCSDNENMHP